MVAVHLLLHQTSPTGDFAHPCHTSVVQLQVAPARTKRRGLGYTNSTLDGLITRWLSLAEVPVSVPGVMLGQRRPVYSGCGLLSELVIVQDVRH